MEREKQKDARDIPGDMRCGIGPCKPDFLQFWARIGPFTGFYSISALVTSILSIYIGSQITAIEKQFGLSSAQSGLLLSCNDFGFLLTTMFFSYIARKVHIPRFICLSSVLYGLAGFLCAVPYFMSRDYVVRQSRELFSDTSAFDVENTSASDTKTNVPLCYEIYEFPYKALISNGSTCDAIDTDEYGIGKPNKYTKTTIVLIAIGMILQGVAKAPRSPFLTTYIDDNGKKKNTAMYLGIITGLAIFGPALAFTIGSFFSRVYVTLEDVPLSPRHPAWIGAWWLGFVVFGLFTIVIAGPLLFFPRRMKPKPVKLSKLSGKERTPMLGFIKAILRLATNPVYCPIQINNFLQSVAFAGVANFFAKYFETQFFIPAWRANILLGTIIVIPVAIGSFAGGIFVSKLKLTPVSCIKLIIVVYILGTIKSGLGFVIGCTNADIVGFNVESNFIGTNTSCSAACGCDSVTYFPVCGSNNVNYLSPCHAGCSEQVGMEFHNCTCGGMGMNISATAGLCDTSCTMLYPFVALNAIAAFFGAMGFIPGFIVSIRSVSEEDKPLSIGVSSVIGTLAWFCGSVLFGRIIDGTCLLWSSSCHGGGACALYDNNVFRFRMHIFQITPSIVGIFMFIFILTRAIKKTDWSSQEQPRVGDEVEGKEAMLNDDRA